MSQLAPFLVVGIVSGSLYALAAMGLVLTFTTSGIFNFAHGAVAAASAYVFYELREQRGLPWPVAAALTVGLVAPAFGLALEAFACRLAEAPIRLRVSGTIGLFLLIYGAATAIYGEAPRTFRPFLPQGRLFKVGVAVVGWNDLIVVLLAAVTAFGLFWFLQRTRTGMAMRGVVDDPDLLALGGRSPRTVRRLSWMIGATFAAVSGILLAPVLGLDALVLTLLVVQAFGAAAIGRFSSMTLTYLGALGLGVAGSVSTRYVADVPNLAGVPASLPFFALFVALVAAKRGGLPGQATGRRASRSRPLSRRASAAVTLPVAAALLAVPGVVGTRLPVFITALAMATIFASLGLLVGTSGQVSLCHGAFAAVGAATFSHVQSAGAPWLLALLVAGVATVPLGALIALPAIRLSGLYLALATFGFALLAEKLLFSMSFLFGAIGSRPVARPHGWGMDLTSDTAFYYVALAVLAVTIALVAAVRGTRLGRMLRGLADSPVALSHHGADVNMIRVVVFCLSAAIAGVGGALLANASGYATTGSFAAVTSLIWFTVLVISGSGGGVSAVIAAGLLVVAPEYLGGGFQKWQTALFGLSAVLLCLRRPGDGDLRATAKAGLIRAAADPRRFPTRAARVRTGHA